MSTLFKLIESHQPDCHGDWCFTDSVVGRAADGTKRSAKFPFLIMGCDAGGVDDEARLGCGAEALVGEEGLVVLLREQLDDTQ